MQFELTDSLIDDIISAMENQDVEYAVDAAEGQLVISDSDGHIPQTRNAEYYKERPCLKFVEKAAEIIENMEKYI